MARVTIEDCLESVPSRFALVLLVAKRAKQLLKGARPTRAVRDNKYVVNSLREVAAGTVRYNIDTEEGSALQQIESDLNNQ